jgi:predicted amidohydrolase YtcJ
MLESYLDGSGAKTGNSGKDFIEPDELVRIVPALDRQGFQCHFHVIGDRAARNALNAIEAALEANGPGDNRHHLAHLQVVHPTDIPRFARLGAVANAQPLWACGERTQSELTMPFLGPERSSWQYPFGSLLRSGARLGMGSDWGVSTADVMEQIDVAVTRLCDGAPVFFEENLISPLQALAAFTSGSAYINHLEDRCGRLAPGRLADLAILDQDPIESGSFHGVGVEATLIGGEVVFSSGWGEGLPGA